MRRKKVSLSRAYYMKVEERSPEILVSFHSSGLTSNQWRKLKNLWFPGRTLFRPSSGTEKGFFAQLDQGAGPTCILYLAEEASDRSDFLPSLDQDLLLLYGQYRSTLVDHMDVEKADSLEPSETSLFHFHLPSSYLSFVCSRYSNPTRQASPNYIFTYGKWQAVPTSRNKPACPCFCLRVRDRKSLVG
uniref:Ribosomal protein L10 n=1 Tax=Ottelia ovalifolia TaxID=241194 RepID=A0A1Z1R0D4_9LILI|nr:ribosomal protein L10 [Ottelia ovalifolia]